MDRRIVVTAGLAVIAVAIVIASLITTRETDQEIMMMLGVFVIIILAISAVRVSPTRIRRIIFLAAGVIALITGLNIAFLPVTMESPVPNLVLSAILVTLGIVCLYKGFPTRSEAGDYRTQDERSLRIGTYGLSYSWYLTFLVVAAMGWITGTGIAPVSGPQACLILIILMPVSARIFQWYFNTRGDVY
jgi:hypothetical protein